MEIITSFFSYVLLIVCLFGLLGLFFRIFTIVFKKGK